MGFKVAVNYAGNAEAADKTAKELGVTAYKWDVGDEAQCKDGIAKVEAELGPVDVLVNNAGHHQGRLLPQNERRAMARSHRASIWTRCSS